MKKIRQIDKKIPLIIFTNISLSKQEYIQKLEKDQHCKFIKKENAYAKELVEKVKSVLNHDNYYF